MRLLRCALLLAVAGASGCSGAVGHAYLPSSPVNVAWDALYLVNATGANVAVYEPHGRVPARTLEDRHMLEPNAVAFDVVGNVYVASQGGGRHRIPSAVYIFRMGESRSRARITDGIDTPLSLVFDSAGNLFVGNRYFEPQHHAGGGCQSVCGSITVYAPGQTKPTRTITRGVAAPSSMAFDQQGNLYVANAYGRSNLGGNVQIYLNGGSRPNRTITNGVNGPGQILFDDSGNLYVANTGGGVSVYPPGASRPARVLDAGQNIQAIALDHEGKLYVLSGWVSVYATGSSEPSRTITTGLNNHPDYMAVDPHDNVYVSEFLGCDPHDIDGCVVVYPHGSSKPSYTIKYPSSPNYLAFGPR